MKASSFSLLVVGLIGGALPLLCAAENDAMARSKSPALAQRVWRLDANRAGERLVMEEPPPANPAGPHPNSNQVAFLAFPPTNWWAGLVPLFAIEKENHFELRRRPAKGLENASDPFCFVLPLADEPEATKVVGRWECTATRPGGSSAWFIWELAPEQEKLSGRFDPSSDFRVAYITGGTFQSNRVSLTVEYVMDRYELVGDWSEAERRMSGKWHQVGEEGKGRWEAKPLPSIRVQLEPADAVPLYEFRRGSDRARRYAITSTMAEPGWERAPRPLGRVWPARPAARP